MLFLWDAILPVFSSLKRPLPPLTLQPPWGLAGSVSFDLKLFCYFLEKCFFLDRHKLLGYKGTAHPY